MKNFIFALLIPFALIAEEEAKPAPETVVETEGVVKVGGKTIPYTAKASTWVLKGDDDKAKINLFTVAYTKKEKNTDRPITFCFNGGPGSSSVWLHLGILGPKRLDFNEEGTKITSSKVIDNPETLLDVTDLVFIDPVSCGFSRPACGEDAKQFYGVDDDIKWIAEFIRLYLTREQRWASPKYLAGESYGTTRAAGLSEHLLANHYIHIEGIVLISTALNFQTLRDPQAGNDLPYPLFLPTFTAAAWYHNKLPKATQDLPLETLLERVEAFALTDYSIALMQGDRLDAKNKKNIAKTLSLYTGLDPELIERNNYRIDWITFAKELEKGRFIGRFDSRIQGIANKDDGLFVDPSFHALSTPFTAAINHYLLNDLKWEKEDNYRVLTSSVHPWNWGQANNQYLNMSRSLVYTLSRRPETRVFVASGLFDMATPYYSIDYTFNHLGIDNTLKKQITMKTYPAGHMLYTHKKSREELKKDLTDFYRNFKQA